MAVTQLLASISVERLARCRRDVGELDRLLSLKFVPPEEYVDLNWAPNGLEKALRLSGLNETAALLERLFGDGDSEIVNRDHPRGPDDYRVYTDITFVEADFVKICSSRLQMLGEDRLDAIFEDAETRFEPDSDVGAGFFRDMFDSLRGFMRRSDLANHAVVAWWD